MDGLSGDAALGASDLQGHSRNSRQCCRRDSDYTDKISATNWWAAQKERCSEGVADNMACTPHVVDTESNSEGIGKRYWETLDRGVGLSLAADRKKAHMIERYKGELVKL